MQENISHMPTFQDNPVCTVVGLSHAGKCKNISTIVHLISVSI